MTLLQFTPPAVTERGPKYLESLIEGWVSLCGKEGIRLGITSDYGQIMFLVDVPGKRQRVIAAQLENAYPGGKTTVRPPRSNKGAAQQSWLRLSPDVYPLKLHHEFIESHSRDAIDPIEGLLEMIKSGRSGRVTTTVWLEIEPLKKRNTQRAIRNAATLASNFRLRTLKNYFERHCSSSAWNHRLALALIRGLVRTRGDPAEVVQEKLSQHLFAASICVETTTDDGNAKFHQHRVQDIKSSLSLFTGFSAVFFVERHPRGSFMLSAPEIATLWHIPTADTQVPRVDRATFKELEPPPKLPRPSDSHDVVTLGRVCFRNERYKFGMDIEARRRHLWVLGKTGMGKSTLLQGIIKQDLEAGRGFAVLEPHGDLAENTFKLVPKRRKNDIIYFDPADPSNTVTFNPLMVPIGSDKTLVADGVLSAFQKVFGLEEGTAPRLLHIFRNCLLSLVEMPGSSLMDVQRILVEPIYRKSVIAQVSNPVVRSFWFDEFGKWKAHDRTAFTASLHNKLGAFLTNDKLQRVLGDPKAKLDLRRVMDDSKVLIVNLSKGRLGENASGLLGTLIVTSLQLAAMSRANIPESDRRDFSIIMDEFQNFTSPSIATFLSEARKYRTHLIGANQFMSQVPEQIVEALRGNAGSQIVFQLGATDAGQLESQFGLQVSATDLQQIPPFHAYCKLHRNVTLPAFSFQTTPLS